MASTPSRGLVLARISDARDGDTHGVEGQVSDCTAHGRKLGWRFGPAGTHVIIENDTSAFRRRKVCRACLHPARECGCPPLRPGEKRETVLRTWRPGFRRALAMLADGQADGLIALDLDRTCRDPRDLEDLIDVVEPACPQIPVESVAGSLRLASDADISMARVMVAMANKASRDTARRVAAARRHRAETGKFGGGVRPFGFEPDGITPRPAEAAEIVRAADAVLQGISLRQILLDLRTRNVPTVKGAPWSSRAVKDMLFRPRNAGLAVYRGEVIGLAPWEPIVPKDIWEAVISKLTDPARRQSPGNTPRWLGSKIYRCGMCGNGTTCHVHGVRERGGQYRCEDGPHLACTASSADAYVSEVIIARLSQPDAAALIAPRHRSRPDIARLRREAASLRELRKEQARLHARRAIDTEQLEAGTAEINAQLAEVEAHLAVHADRNPLAGIAGNPEAAAVWAGLDLGRQRAILSALMTVTILPATPSGPRFRTERVKIEWREPH